MDDTKNEFKVFYGDVVIKPMLNVKIHVPRTSNGEVPPVLVPLSKGSFWLFGILQFGDILDSKWCIHLAGTYVNCDHHG